MSSHVLKAVALVATLVFALGSSGALAEGTGRTVTFDNTESHDLETELDGQLPSGVIDWGSGMWYLSGPWQELTINSLSFTETRSSASFHFVSPQQLVRLDAYNGDEKAAATITLTCAGQATKQLEVNANEIRTIDTGWSAACSDVGISSSNGWMTNFLNLVIK